MPPPTPTEPPAIRNCPITSPRLIIQLEAMLFISGFCQQKWIFEKKALTQDFILFFLNAQKLTLEKLVQLLL